MNMEIKYRRIILDRDNQILELTDTIKLQEEAMENYELQISVLAKKLEKLEKKEGKKDADN